MTNEVEGTRSEVRSTGKMTNFKFQMTNDNSLPVACTCAQLPEISKV
jgi:hypothetical protein